MPARKVVVAAVVLIAVLCGTMAVRALLASSRQVPVKPVPAIQLDRDAVVARLSQAVRFKTISGKEGNSASAAEQTALAAWLMEAYPNVHRLLTREAVGQGSLLYTWPGSRQELPALLLLAHTDVVPVEVASESQWIHPAFSGAIADGFIWGRGTLDDKGSIAAILEAAEYLAAQGFQPKQTLMFAFGHDEEIGGQGAQAIVRLLQARGVKIDAVIDEGGIIAQGILPGVAAPVALVGIAEKGYVSVVLEVTGEGGHSSMPPAMTPVGRLARAIDRIQGHPFPADLRGATEQMFRFLAPEMSPVLRAVAANLWLTEPLIEWQATKSPSMNATVRTTAAPTVISGGVKENVIAPSARAVVNFRILPGDTIEDVLSHVIKVVDDPLVNVHTGDIRSEPSNVSDPAAPQFQQLAAVIRGVYTDAVVAPFLVVAATDSRHYGSLTKNIYRFRPFRLRQQDLQRFHGTNERIAIADYTDAIRFYCALMTGWAH